MKILADKVANEGIDRNGDGDVRDAGEGETFHVVLSEPINAEFNGAAGDGGGANGVNTSAARNEIRCRPSPERLHHLDKLWFKALPSK